MVIPLSLVFVGILVLLLRWTYSTGHSVVARRPRPGHQDEYGLLVAVSDPATYIEGEMQRQTLEASGIRATLAQTLDGPRLMVFRHDRERARALLRVR